MSYVSEVTADSPVSWWRLDETSGTVAADHQSVNTGTYVGTVTLNQTAAVDSGKSITMAGAGSVAATGPHVNGLTAWTMEAWVRVDTIVDQATILSDRSGATPLCILRAMGTGRLRLSFRGATGAINTVDASSGSINGGAWHHVCARLLSGSFTLWLDGAQVGSLAQTAALTVTSTAFNIGVDVLDGLNFKGGIDEVAFYNTGLSSGRIAAHFAAGTSPVNTVAPAITTDGTPESGETITFDHGTWTGSPTSYTWQVKRNNSPIGGETGTFSGATPGSYDLVSLDEGAAISVTVTATNASASTDQDSNSITPIVSALLATDVVFKLSGGTDNASPLLSIGGAEGVTIADPAPSQAVLDRILGTVALAGQTDYRLIYVHNNHATRDGDVVAYVAQQIVVDDPDTLQIDIGVAVEAAGVEVAATADRLTAPDSVTFSAPPDSGSGLEMGTIPAESFRGLWIRRTALAGTPLNLSNPSQIGFLITEVP